MRQPVSNLTQSRFYSPAFNAAIFDGPLRVYFAQYQEGQALKVYFRLQERLRDVYARAKQTLKAQGINIFVMLYPTDEIFENCFGSGPTTKKPGFENLGEDEVLGTCGSLRDDEIEGLVSAIEERLAERMRQFIPQEMPAASV